MSTVITDYDRNGYDYRTYWQGRDYEAWAEERALQRMVPLLGRPEWMVDFGAGFGRNAKHYRNQAGRYVLVDYSSTNLRNAARELAADVGAGRAFLVRADLSRLPFADAAFDAAMVVRVLHHLPDLPAALVEMGRTVRDRWLLDIPIKHHVLALTRAAVRGELSAIRGPQPLRTGQTATPFWNFRLSEVREQLHAAAWDTRLVGSVNNLRRWDRALPPAVVRTLRPAAQAVETVARHGGRGWWGPSQFVYARRGTILPAPETADTMQARLRCTACRAALDWTPSSATCRGCATVYPCIDGYWDFVLPSAG